MSKKDKASASDAPEKGKPRDPGPAAGKGKGAKTKPPESWPAERGGPKGPEPTRYGDWDKGGRCSDF